MQNNLLFIGAELEKYRCKGVEMRELHDRKIYFTGLLQNITVLIFQCSV